MCGCVDLEHIHVAAFRDLDARLAHAARRRRRALHAAERARENPRRRRLADAARTREHEGLREPPALDGVLQRTRHRALSDDIVERLRPPFSCDYLVSHAGNTKSTAIRSTCGTWQGLLSAAAFRP